ncbi:MAG: hypothetical protein Nk1A_1170 [Endomicrobiia bacterium]|nr:MAG: hypothetical protein Nk1A_1170 [Endomicrobiia bacterium]
MDKLKANSGILKRMILTETLLLIINKLAEVVYAPVTNPENVDIYHQSYGGMPCAPYYNI